MTLKHLLKRYDYLTTRSNKVLNWSPLTLESPMVLFGCANYFNFFFFVLDIQYRILKMCVCDYKYKHIILYNDINNINIIFH